MIKGYQDISGSRMNWAEINASLAKSILKQFKSM